ncbi:hypothetical protein HMI56_005280, partial [Coelomomyces lativittatus]
MYHEWWPPIRFSTSIQPRRSPLTHVLGCVVVLVLRIPYLTQGGPTLDWVMNVEIMRGCSTFSMQQVN